MVRSGSALALLAVVLLAGCSSGPTQPDAAAPAPPSATQSAAPQPPVTSAPVTPTPEPVVTPSPSPRWTLTCTDEDDDDQDFTSLAAVWKELPHADSCDVEYTGDEDYTPTGAEKKVIHQLASYWDGTEEPENVYAKALEVCAERGSDPLDHPVEYARAALLACPKAPQAARLRGVAQGTIFDDGSREIGKDSPPGTYRSEKGVQDCYWSRETPSGSIIANGFIDFAPKGVTVTVHKGEGFTTQDCGVWKKVG